MVDLELVSKSPCNEFSDGPTTALQIREILRRKSGARCDILLRQTLLREKSEKIHQALSTQVLNLKGLGRFGHLQQYLWPGIDRKYNNIYTSVEVFARTHYPRPLTRTPAPERCVEHTGHRRL